MTGRVYTTLEQIERMQIAEEDRRTSCFLGTEEERGRPTTTWEDVIKIAMSDRSIEEHEW